MSERGHPRFLTLSQARRNRDAEAGAFGFPRLSEDDHQAPDDLPVRVPDHDELAINRDIRHATMAVDGETSITTSQPALVRDARLS